ncbi:MAG: hypothetical protein V8T36_12750 [Ruthenibacterium lactatiformans]
MSWARKRALPPPNTGPGYIIPTCGYCSEIIYLYAATGLSPVGQHLDADEFLWVFTLPLDKAAEMVLRRDHRQ